MYVYAHMCIYIYTYIYIYEYVYVYLCVYRETGRRSLESHFLDSFTFQVFCLRIVLLPSYPTQIPCLCTKHWQIAAIQLSSASLPY